MNNVATTRIEKKYKDKSTGEYKTLTINYALVPDRLLEFRQKNPRAVIETKPLIEGKTLIFEARIVKDKKDPNSAEATGHAYGSLDTDKAFEKLETQAVGRALAILGYLNNGKVATTEEMLEFESYQMEQIVIDIRAAKNRSEFQAILSKLNPAQKKEVTPLINQRIKELKDEQSSTSRTAK